MSKVKHGRWFKSGRVDFTSTEKIDAENGILFGVIMCQVGEAKGHEVHLEQSFIDDGISYAKRNHKIGMKARFGHPSMSNETLGTEMGRFKDFRVDGERMVADLHLFESANISPTQPNMRNWMISMAQEDPAAIMCSIVFKPEYEYQYDSAGKRVNIWFYDDKGRVHRCRNKNGEANEYNPNEKMYISLDHLYFCDIVDEGAATDKLFSAQFNSDKFSVIATEFLNDHPQIDEFIQEKPEKILEFLSDRFGIETEKEPGVLDGFLKFFQPKQSNQKSFYMAKVQLSKLAALAEKIGKNEAGPEDYAAVQTELQEQGIEVVVLGSGNHDALQKQLKQLKTSAEAFSAAVLKLAPDTKEEDIPSVNLSELITKALAEKDVEIKKLQDEVDGKTEDPKTPKSEGQQEFDDDEEEPELSEAEKERKELRSVMNVANDLSK